LSPAGVPTPRPSAWPEEAPSLVLAAPSLPNSFLITLFLLRLFAWPTSWRANAMLSTNCPMKFLMSACLGTGQIMVKGRKLWEGMAVLAAMHGSRKSREVSP